MLDWNLQSPDGTIWTPSLEYVDVYGNYSSLCGWNLQSPDGKVWTPAITSEGVLTWSHSTLPELKPVSAVPVIQDVDSTDVWIPSMSNDGVLTLTSQAGAGETTTAGISDDLGQVWSLFISADNGLIWTVLSKLRPLALRWTPGVGTASEVPVLLEVGDDMMWIPSIDNYGTLTFMMVMQDNQISAELRLFL